MLQDLEAGRAVELDAILGTLIECAAAVAMPVPTLASVRALARMRARTAALPAC
jgi:2-dehydropantoate 2-reductase